MLKRFVSEFNSGRGDGWGIMVRVRGVGEESTWNIQLPGSCLCWWTSPLKFWFPKGSKPLNPFLLLKSTFTPFTFLPTSSAPGSNRLPNNETETCYYLNRAMGFVFLSIIFVPLGSFFYPLKNTFEMNGHHSVRVLFPF